MNPPPRKFFDISAAACRRFCRIFMTAVFLCCAYSGCTNLWYISGETGDGPVVNNDAPTAIPEAMAVQEMINFLSVSAMMNNWYSMEVSCRRDMKTIQVFNGVAPLLQWRAAGAGAAAELQSTMDGPRWTLRLCHGKSIMWEHTVTLLDSTSDMEPEIL